MAVTAVIMVEFIRAWLVVRKKNVDVEKTNSENYEKGLILQYWTRHLDESARKKGDTFMVRDRVRWTIFQVILVGL